MMRGAHNDPVSRLKAFLGQHQLLHGDDISGDRITAIAHTEFAPLLASDLSSVLEELREAKITLKNIAAEVKSLEL